MVVRRSALALTHVGFEDLGSLTPALEKHGYDVRYADACTLFHETPDLASPDLLVVLGGPISVYDSGSYPFLVQEISSVRERLAHQRPTLGICLGAQLMTAALGGKVHPGGNGKEVGWSPLLPGPDAAAFAPMAELLHPQLHVLHWHGDTFTLPRDARHLAASRQYANQAWCTNECTLALQFHPEVLEENLERWYVGHACELANAGIDIPALRSAAREHAPILRHAAQRFWHAWLDML